MKEKDLKTINNLKLRYQDYDRNGQKYAYDIYYTTIHATGQMLKASRECGSDNFGRHIEELTSSYDGVATITVADFAGVSKKAKELNPPLVIELMDIQSIQSTPKFVIHNQSQEEHPKNNSDFSGLMGLLGIEYEALGNLAPVVKVIDDKHTIERLKEKIENISNDLQNEKQKVISLTNEKEALTLKYSNLEDETDDLADELKIYREKEAKRGQFSGLFGAVLASGAKTFLQQNPSILSGIIPAEQLAGILNHSTEQEEPMPTPQLSAEEQERLDDATIVFEWLQTLTGQRLEDVISIIAVIRQKPEYIPLIINYLQGGTHDDDNS